MSFWHEHLAPLPEREALGDRVVHADVAIIGGGYTGLWTALSLIDIDPSLSIAVVEAEQVGFGASGRNGGWCSALFPRGTESLERAHGTAAAVAMRHAMIDTVGEVGRAAEALGIDCDFVRGGTIVFARNRAQDNAARADAATAQKYGVDDVRVIEAVDVAARYGVSSPDGRAHIATEDANCARLHPAKLVRGLAAACDERGVQIFEGTRATGFVPGFVTTRDREGRNGQVRAPRILIATEGYGAQLDGVRRRILPLYSLVLATEPLPEHVWDEIGLTHGQTFSDYRNLIVYGQRTADNRIVFGGRGARYHLGSAIRPEYDRVARVYRHLESELVEMFPALAGHLTVASRWGGPLGVPRDWHAGVAYNPHTGIGFAGGYVGDGVATTNLAGRTLADLALERTSDLTSLPWVNHLSPKWEPEPLRFFAANAGLVGMEVADYEERVTGRSSLAARLMAPFIGH